MKFDKYLYAQSVPEWRKKYINYHALKKQIKRISLALAEQMSLPLSLSRTSLISIHSDGTASPPPFNQTLSQVSVMPVLEGEEMLLESLYTRLESRLPEERAFFKFLIKELDKINRFYKENEDILAHQFNALKTQAEFARSQRGDIRKKWKNKILKRFNFTISSTHPRNSADLDDASAPRNSGISNGSNSHSVDHSDAGSTDGASSPTAVSKVKISGVSKVKKCFSEFYRNCETLKNYRVLNRLGFSKILKKYDKTTQWNSTEYFMPIVTMSIFQTSNVIDKLVSETEKLFVEYFEGGDRKKAMDKLRIPDLNLKTHHFASFRTGMYIGVSLPLLLYTALQISQSAINPDSDPNKSIKSTLFHIYAGFSLPIIFCLLFGINLLVWTKTRINYVFIFEFDARNHLHFSQFFEFGGIMLFLFSLTVFFTFSNIFPSVPLSWYAEMMVLAVVICLFLPVQKFYHSSRFWLLNVVWRIITTPITRVEFRDFFLTDELCSMVYTIVAVELFGCSVLNDWKDLNNRCNVSVMWITPFLTMLPSWWRFIQCIRRYYDASKAKQYSQGRWHLLNAGKYVSSISVIMFGSFSKIIGSNVLQGIWIFFSIVATLYTYSWDVYMDWGLGRTKSKHFLLRDELMYSRQWLYYFALFSNLLLRGSWIVVLSQNLWSDGVIEEEAVTYIQAFLELLRRFQWNFYRLENEQLNNTDNFRAFVEIPLPFERLHEHELEED